MARRKKHRKVKHKRKHKKGHRKSAKRSRAAKQRYRNSALYKLNQRRKHKKHGRKHKKGRRKGKRKHVYHYRGKKYHKRKFGKKKVAERLARLRAHHAKKGVSTPYLQQLRRRMDVIHAIRAAEAPAPPARGVVARWN